MTLWMPQGSLLSRGALDAAAGGGAYTAQGVTFDGTNDYMTLGSNLTGVVDGKVGLISFWFKFNGSNASYHMFLENVAGNFSCYRTNTGAMGGIGNNAAAVGILAYASGTLFSSPMSWTHCLWSWDLAAGYNVMYLNDVLDTPGILTTTNDTIDYSAASPGWTFGHRTTGALILNADMADFYFNPAVSLNLGTLANRRLFISGTGHPVDLGSDGSIPTGSAPAVYLSGTTAAWNTNKGAGGGFTLTGALTASGTNP